MNDQTPEIRPTAIAEFLRHRFRIQPGAGICIPLGLPDSRDNFEALTRWVRLQVAKQSGQPTREMLHRIEQAFIDRMTSAGFSEELAEIDPLVGLDSDDIPHVQSDDGARTASRMSDQKKRTARIIQLPTRLLH